MVPGWVPAGARKRFDRWRDRVADPRLDRAQGAERDPNAQELPEKDDRLSGG